MQPENVKLFIPETPEVTNLGDDVYQLSEPVIVDGVPYEFVKQSTGLESVLGEYETYNLFVCNAQGQILDFGGLCHQAYTGDGPSWMYDLPEEEENYPVFILWEGGGLEEFKNRDEARDEIMVMESRGCKHMMFDSREEAESALKAMASAFNKK